MLGMKFFDLQKHIVYFSQSNFVTCLRLSTYSYTICWIKCALVLMICQRTDFIDRVLLLSHIKQIDCMSARVCSVVKYFVDHTRCLNVVGKLVTDLAASPHVLLLRSSTSSVICSEEMHSNMQSICWIYSYHSCLHLVHAINFYWLFILSHYSSVSGKTEEGETEESLHVSYWVNNHLFI